MNSILHKVYKIFGHLFCRACLLYWRTKDFISPPNETAVLFVAHPDDDTLFFHTFIKAYRPYVCLCTTGWSLRRLFCFFKTMKYYGVRFRAYDLDSRDSREGLLKKNIRELLDVGNFEICATHNSTGEYGHEMHVRVHNAVVSEFRKFVCVPSDAFDIKKFPLDIETIKEKEGIFRNYYTTEKWVLDEKREWVICEHVE